MRLTIIIFATLFISNSLFAQFSIHLNYSEPTKTGIGIGYDFSKRFWSNLTFSRGIVDEEAHVEPVLERFRIDNLSANLTANYNIIAKEHYDTYLGIGGLVNFYAETYAFFTVPVGIRVRPFEQLNKPALSIELQPAINGSDVYLFGCLGVHYSF